MSKIEKFFVVFLNVELRTIRVLTWSIVKDLVVIETAFDFTEN